MRSYVKWTREEKNFIKDNYWSMTNKKIASLLPNRTRKNVALMGFRLGITDGRKRYKPSRFIEKNPYALSEIEWAYIAGIFDGEGSLPHHKKCDFVVDVVNSTDKNIIDWVHKKFPGSRLYQITKHPRKIAWRVSICRRNGIYWFMKKVNPFVIIKKVKNKLWLKKFEEWYLKRGGGVTC